MAGTSPPRRQARFILGLVLILAALPLGYFVFLYQPPAPPPPPPPPPPPVVEKAPEQPVQMKLSSIEGSVEVRRAGGGWGPAAVGKLLEPSDSVRTKDGSVAVILAGESVKVTVDPGSEVSVQELTAKVTRVLLEKGMARAVVNPGKQHTIELKAGGSDAVASTSDGAFAMSNDGAGTVAVGASEGAVSFSGSGKVVIVRAGQQSVVRPGSDGPTEPVKIPSSLLRKVQWPESLQKTRKIVIRGEAEPGTRLELAGQAFSPNQDGTFASTVELKEGEQEVRIRVSSVGGTSQEEKQTFQVDTKAPTLKVKVPWGNPGGQAPPGQGQE